VQLQYQDAAIVSLEAEIRRNVLKSVFFLTCVCFLLEIGIGIYLLESGNLRQSFPEYVALRIVEPSIINLIIYLIAKIISLSDKFSDTTKNRAASVSLLLFAGLLSVIHSYFIPVWGLSLFAMMYSSIFHDSYFHKFEGVVCLIFIAFAARQHNLDYPDQIEFTKQCLIVTEVVGLTICYLAFKLEKYTRSEYTINARNSAGVRRYKKGYETDVLTGLSSRAHLADEAKRLLSEASELSPVGIAILDIDDFKKVNDTYGHDNGDIVLSRFGELMGSYAGDSIVCGRYGGEEFVMLFAYGQQDKDYNTLEELRTIFGTMSFPFTTNNITVSGGYALIEAPTEFESAISVADKALYRSKRKGKNKITISGKADDTEETI